ncbi:hypothetical protein [Pontiella agarivorans]|uniref:Uncharacterized protein n=1 Tax=Pontiella agarivorans TaxID=3038953 RepID=A0ABU5MY22_9BACT|nr:hypothetical protein [Pontiella agarivorans]MDZ8119092.1 hypothetical protein [Pontiella agarivorans]
MIEDASRRLSFNQGIDVNGRGICNEKKFFLCSDTERAVPRLKAYARQALEHPEELAGLLHSSLASKIRHCRCLEDNIQQIHREIVQQLANMPVVMLTSVWGIGTTLASGVSAMELER